MIVVQLGFAMMPRCFWISAGLISGTTKGTSGSIRKAEELSITTAPGADGMLRVFPGGTGPGAEQCDVDRPERILRKRFDRYLFALEFEYFPRRLG